MALGNVFFADAFRAALREFGPKSIVSFEALVGMPWGHSDPIRTADRLRDVVPDAEILIVTRDEVALTRSLYSQYVHEGGWVQFDDFGQVLNAEYLDIESTLERFRSRFERVLVLDHSLLIEDPEEALRRISEFAGIHLSLPPNRRHENVSLNGWRLELLRRWNKIFRESELNPSPWVSIPYAGAMRTLLQRRVQFTRRRA